MKLCTKWHILAIQFLVFLHRSFAYANPLDRLNDEFKIVRPFTVTEETGNTTFYAKLGTLPMSRHLIWVRACEVLIMKVSKLKIVCLKVPTFKAPTKKVSKIAYFSL